MTTKRPLTGCVGVSVSMTNDEIHREAEYLQTLCAQLVPIESISRAVRDDTVDPEVHEELRSQLLEVQAQELDAEHLNMLKTLLDHYDDPVPESFIEEEIELVRHTFFHEWVSCICDAVLLCRGEATLDSIFAPHKFLMEAENLGPGESDITDAWQYMSQELPFDDLELESFKQDFSSRLRANLPLKLVRGIVIYETPEGYVAREEKPVNLLGQT